MREPSSSIVAEDGERASFATFVTGEELQVMEAEADLSPEVTVMVADPEEAQTAETLEPLVAERVAQEPEMDQE